MDFLPALRRRATIANITTLGSDTSDTTRYGWGRESKATVVLSDYYEQLVANVVGGALDKRRKPWTIERAVAEGYERVVWVYKAVDTIASDSARLPLRVKRGEHVLDDHPLYEVFNGQANPLESGRDFRKRLSMQVLLSPLGAFVQVTENRRGEVARLDLLPPNRVKPVPGDGKNLLKGFDLYDEHNRVKARLKPEQVLWFREPHPTDPYRASTPLEAAGLSVELDYFSRLFNANFMRNDGRPGGIVGVEGEMDEQEMNRVEARFGKGPHEAGKLSVIEGRLTYIDVAAKPRDMQYQSTSRNAKVEILVAFGVPESQIGNSAERTFSNADHEGYRYWTGRMADHNGLIVSGCGRYLGPGETAYLDTSGIEVLDLPLRQRREEMRAEVTAGVRSYYSYAQEAGIEGVEDTPLTRALWLPSGRVPIPARAEDAEALGMPPTGGGSGTQRQATDQEQDDQAEGGASAGDITNPATGPATDGTPTPATAPPTRGGGGAAAPVRAAAPQPAPATVTAVTATKALPRQPRLRVVVHRETKAAEDDEDPARADLEDAVADALEALAETWVERAVARLRSPKQRKHTRHWSPEYEHDTRLGTKAVDAARIVDGQRWAQEAQEAVAAILADTTAEQAERLARDLGVADALTDASPPDSPAAETAAVALLAAAGTALPVWLLHRLARRVVQPVLDLVATSAERIAAVLADAITDGDRSGMDLGDIADRVRDFRGTQQQWARGLAVQTATATVEGAQTTTAEAAVDAGTLRAVNRTWRSRRDERVRETHRVAHGQVQPVGEPFTIGTARLRYPGDPLAPFRETANCRCRLTYRAVRTGRYVPPPPGEVTRNPRRTA